MGQTHKRSVRIRVDFGRAGIQPDELKLHYDSSLGYEMPGGLAEKIDRIWDGQLAAGKKMENERLFNYVEMYNLSSPYYLLVGPTEFKHYVGASEILAFGGAEKHGVSGYESTFLQSAVHPISVCTAVETSDGFYVMREKGPGVWKAGAGRISFPGFGYTNEGRDTYTEHKIVKDVRSIALRKVREDLNIHGSLVGDMRTLGIYEDTSAESHLNPGIFSVAKTGLSSDELLRLHGYAEKDWKHTGPFVFVPTDDQSAFESYIQSDESYGAETVRMSDASSSKIRGMEGMRTIKTTVKSNFMLHLIGRLRYGNDWYVSQMEKHSGHTKLASY